MGIRERGIFRIDVTVKCGKKAYFDSVWGVRVYGDGGLILGF